MRVASGMGCESMPDRLDASVKLKMDETDDSPILKSFQRRKDQPRIIENLYIINFLHGKKTSSCIG